MCGRESANLKPFHGLQLGMPLTLKGSPLDMYVGGGVIPDASELGLLQESQYSLNGYGISQPVLDPKGIEQVDLSTLDGRLVRFEIHYDNSTRWKDDI